MSLIKDRFNKEWTNDCKVAFNTARDFGITSISRLIEVIAVTFSVKDWDYYDPKSMMNGEFDSYLLDKLGDFFYDKEVDFEEVKEKILEYGDFSIAEKSMFKPGKLEERIWGIFLSLLPNDKRIDNLDDRS